LALFWSLLWLLRRGNLKTRAKRLFAVKGLKLENIPAKHRAKAASGPTPQAAADAAAAGSSSSSSADGSASARAAIGAVPWATSLPPGRMRAVWLERVIDTMAQAQRTKIRATRQRIERRSTLSADERDEDQAAEETKARGGDADDGDADGLSGRAAGGGAGDEYDSDDDPLAGSKADLKKNAVLGPDGEPISYWLYKVSFPSSLFWLQSRKASLWRRCLMRFCLPFAGLPDAAAWLRQIVLVRDLRTDHVGTEEL
jgi:hypothetical protein